MKKIVIPWIKNLKILSYHSNSLKSIIERYKSIYTISINIIIIITMFNI